MTVVWGRVVRLYFGDTGPLVGVLQLDLVCSLVFKRSKWLGKEVAACEEGGMGGRAHGGGGRGAPVQRFFLDLVLPMTPQQPVWGDNATLVWGGGELAGLDRWLHGAGMCGAGPGGGGVQQPVSAWGWNVWVWGRAEGGGGGGGFLKKTKNPKKRAVRYLFVAGPHLKGINLPVVG